MFFLLMPFSTCLRFPLFSKGVDTYRFEYGVFLLNKDIEMVGSLHLKSVNVLNYILQLMSERDLRALDMRHTLPNLKNLLLTLSHDINIHHQYVVIPVISTHTLMP